VSHGGRREGQEGGPLNEPYSAVAFARDVAIIVFVIVWIVQNV
jgi:hypothetical protein